MNWRKGFLRLWLVLSLLWFIAVSFWQMSVLIEYYEARDHLQMLENERDNYFSRFDTSSQKLAAEQRIAVASARARSSKQHLISLAIILFLPSLCVLLFGTLLHWVWRGFAE